MKTYLIELLDRFEFWVMTFVSYLEDFAPYMITSFLSILFYQLAIGG